ncbi:hypothetical protein ACH5RR_025953 [Cinchona calisaya]|uniref:Uncharacterized protein n=1 Tax=Cinchona calisaya TaxID=153742 RepID=A0ABD2Z323_9GENT
MLVLNSINIVTYDGWGMTEKQFLDHFSDMKPYISPDLFILFGSIFDNWGLEDFMNCEGFTNSMRCAIAFGDWQNSAKIMWNPSKVGVKLLCRQNNDILPLVICRLNYKAFVKEAFKVTREDPVATCIEETIQ